MILFAFYIQIWLTTFSIRPTISTTSVPLQIESKVLQRSKRDISVYSDDRKYMCPETSPTLCYYSSFDHSCYAHSDCPGNHLCCLFACSYDCSRPLPVPQVIVEDYEYDVTDYSYEDIRERVDQLHAATPRGTLELAADVGMNSSTKTTVSPSLRVDQLHTSTPRDTLEFGRNVENKSFSLTPTKLTTYSNVTNSMFNDAISKSAISFKKEFRLHDTTPRDKLGKYRNMGMNSSTFTRAKLKTDTIVFNGTFNGVHKQSGFAFKQGVFGDFRPVTHMKYNRNESNTTQISILLGHDELLEDFRGVIQLKPKEQLNTNETLTNNTESLNDFHGVIQLYSNAKPTASIILLKYTKENLGAQLNTNETGLNLTTPIRYRQEILDDFRGIIQFQPKKITLINSVDPVVRKKGDSNNFLGVIEMNESERTSKTTNSTKYSKDYSGDVIRYSTLPYKSSNYKENEDSLRDFLSIIQLIPKQDFSKSYESVINRQSNYYDKELKQPKSKYNLPYIKTLKIINQKNKGNFHFIPQAKMNDMFRSAPEEQQIQTLGRTKIMHQHFNTNTSVQGVFYRKPNINKKFKNQLKQIAVILKENSENNDTRRKSMDFSIPSETSFTSPYASNSGIPDINQVTNKHINIKNDNQKHNTTPSYSKYIEELFKNVDDELNAIEPDEKYNELYENKILLKNKKNISEIFNTAVDQQKISKTQKALSSEVTNSHTKTSKISYIGLETLYDYAVDKLLDVENKGQEEWENNQTISPNPIKTHTINEMYDTQFDYNRNSNKEVISATENIDINTSSKTKSRIQTLRSEKHAKFNMGLQANNVLESLEEDVLEKILEAENRKEMVKSTTSDKFKGGIHELNSKKLDKHFKIHVNTKQIKVDNLDEDAVGKLIQNERKRKTKYYGYNKGISTRIYQGKNKGKNWLVYKKIYAKNKNFFTPSSFKHKNHDYHGDHAIENERRNKDFSKRIYENTTPAIENVYFTKSLKIKVDEKVGRNKFKIKNQDSHFKKFNDHISEKSLSNENMSKDIHYAVTNSPITEKFNLNNNKYSNMLHELQELESIYNDNKEVKRMKHEKNHALEKYHANKRITKDSYHAVTNIPKAVTFKLNDTNNLNFIRELQEFESIYNEKVNRLKFKKDQSLVKSHADKSITKDTYNELRSSPEAITFKLNGTNNLNLIHELQKFESIYSEKVNRLKFKNDQPLEKSHADKSITKDTYNELRSSPRSNKYFKLETEI
ncbi:hypothetical protein JTE90_010630 [Oedothorax gibbosus]|uniref:WAP domain-containing protein n=1 Tax=Oedothorax gibbosus TaxID=931172 RepID=A0AAV6VJ95_9ARAC|nr:hypothetical protein JTE90_010630 [Oedothorax gibbosus]